MVKKTRRPSKARTYALVLSVYTATVFLSAFLLFGVQPMFTRMVLPRLGGSPSVWSVAMVFFQTMLLAGYAYAHVLTSLRNRYAAAVIHLLVLITAALTLPLSITQAWESPPNNSAPAFWLLGLFVLSIGLPFFALAANNPLLQAWFVQTGHRDAHDPYFLYAASNIGSFIALLAYPALFEPVFTLHIQNELWTAGFLLLIAFVVSCAALTLQKPSRFAGRTKISAGPKPKSVGNCSLDIHRGDPVRAACSDHRLHLNRYRRCTATLGHPTIVVLANMGAGISATTADPAQVCTITATVRDSRHCGARALYRLAWALL